jgi:CcmD family protein
MDQRNFEYMFYGLAAAWTILCLYSLLLTSRGRKIQSEIDHLRRMLDASPKK